MNISLFVERLPSVLPATARFRSFLLTAFLRSLLPAPSLSLSSQHPSSVFAASSLHQLSLADTICKLLCRNCLSHPADSLYMLRLHGVLLRSSAGGGPIAIQTSVKSGPKCRRWSPIAQTSVKSGSKCRRWSPIAQTSVSGGSVWTATWTAAGIAVETVVETVTETVPLLTC